MNYSDLIVEHVFVEVGTGELKFTADNYSVFLNDFKFKYSDKIHFIKEPGKLFQKREMVLPNTIMLECLSSETGKYYAVMLIKNNYNYTVSVTYLHE